eukprot:gb/GFBE01024622.1/.p1 GENE.gb/GFBE01024622.1/~~gb/GFBE01024622.1/.p1  ORF type:complete len:162 (+),score=11.07 gb/GFBE01024622.1/:1-486(+)
MAQLRSETRAALQAVEVRYELQGVAQGATQLLAGILGNALRAGGSAGVGSPSEQTFSEFKTPVRRNLATGARANFTVPTLPLSAAGRSSNALVSPAASTSASVGSRLAADQSTWPLPWGPPPAVARDLPFETGAAASEHAGARCWSEGLSSRDAAQLSLGG